MVISLNLATSSMRLCGGRPRGLAAAFEGREEALAHCVGVGVAGRPHRTADAIGCRQHPPFNTRRPSLFSGGDSHQGWVGDDLNASCRAAAAARIWRSAAGGGAGVVGRVPSALGSDTGRPASFRGKEMSALSGGGTAVRGLTRATATDRSSSSRPLSSASLLKPTTTPSLSSGPPIPRRSSPTALASASAGLRSRLDPHRFTRCICPIG